MKITFILSAVLVMTMSLLANAEGDRLQVWRSSYFDGNDFRDGIALNKATVYRRDGYLPIVHSGEDSPPNDRLPKGTGAVVIHCFIQSSGGKILKSAGSHAVPYVAIEVKDGDRKLMVRSDAEGYALIALPVGEYEVSVQGMKRTVTVEKGKTLLMPIRVGKRMVD